MPNVTISVTEEKKLLIDELAAAQDMDMSCVVNQALDNYLEAAEWQLAHIKEGLRQAEAGEFATDAEVKSAFDIWKSKC